MLQKTIKVHIARFWTTDTQVRTESSKVAIPSLFPDTSYVYLTSLLESTESPALGRMARLPGGTVARPGPAEGQRLPPSLSGVCKGLVYY